MEKGILVSNQNYLLPGGGGVQWCTRDYLEAIAASGIQADTIAYKNDQSLVARIRRKVVPRPFQNLVPANVAVEIEAMRRRGGASLVFLNNSEPLPLAAAIKLGSRGAARIIYLSHGVESTDQLNELRIDAQSVPGHRRRPQWIGRLFLTELEQRRHLDGVVCMSEEDTLFERWLGSERVCFLPRMVRMSPFDWQPRTGRVGTVATLNHLPNLDGIRRLAAEIDALAGVRLRVVGQPAAVGEKLAGEFRCVDYLGGLDDAAFKAEAATWCAFVNPIFCQARGASTKVATVLGWGLPVVTSVQGARGY